MIDLTKHAEAKRWVSTLPREEFNLVLVLTNLRYEKGFEAGAEAMRERCATVGFEINLPLAPGLADGASMAIDAYADAIRAIQPASLRGTSHEH